MSTGGYVAELAKSGAAKCRLCETNILKGLLRVGKLIDGDWGLQTRWYHLHCLVLRVDSIDEIDGASELSAEHRAALLARVEESREEVDEEAVPVDPDAIVRTEWSAEVEPPRELLLPLLPYQREGLAWLLHQERVSDMRGGILADEMGMGKTIQAVALLLAHRRDRADPVQTAAWEQADRRHGVELSKLRGGTLVVVPVVAMGQWQTEIARFTAAGALTVKVFHGAGRAEDLKVFAEADVVLTSYKTLEAAYRKQSAGTKVECSVCGRKFYAEKLRVHRTYFCGEGARKTAAQAKQQRKGRGRDSSTTREDISDESDHSDVDEVDRQKRLLREMKEQKSGGKGASKKERKVESSSKKRKGIKGRAPSSKAARTEAVVSTTGGRVRATRRAAAAVRSYRERSDEDDSEEWTSSGRGNGSSSSSEETSEASLETETSSDDASDEDSASSDVSSVAPRARGQRGSRMLGRAQVLIDEDVERDIQAAQRKAPKAVASPLHKASLSVRYTM